MGVVLQDQPSVSFNQQAQNIARQKALAEALQKGGEYDPNQMVSGRVVPLSPLTALSKALQTGYGSYLAADAGKQQAAMEDNKLAAMAKILSRKPGESLDYGQISNVMGPEMGLKLMSDELTRNDNHQLKLDEIKQTQALRAQDKAEADQRAADLRRELQQNQLQAIQDNLKLSASLRPAPQEPAPQLIQDDKGNYLQVHRNGQVTPLNVHGQMKFGQSPETTDLSKWDLEATKYNQTGQLPPLGMGGSGAKQQIIDRARELRQQQGITDNNQLITDQAGFKASSTALNQLQKQQTMVSAFEKNAQKNADMALELSGKVDRTGSPVLNTWIQAGQKNVTGNPELSKFHAANETFVNEYAKIMSGSMGNTVVSDSMRAHAHSLLSTAQNPQQYKAVVDTLRQEMGNRMQGFEDEKQALMQSMHGKEQDSVSAGPKVGAVEDGHVYLGGDPANPASWKKQ